MPKAQPIFNEINITPLTDIFLVLLIIMMVVAPMLDYPGLKLSVPSIGPDQQTTEEPKTQKINISAANAYMVDGQAVPVFQLAQRLRTQAATKPDGVVIEANPQATHQALTTAMDATQQAGITKVAVVAEQPTEPTAP